MSAHTIAEGVLMLGPSENDNRKYSCPSLVISKTMVADGKYTFLRLRGDWRVHVLRYDDPWLVIEDGHKAIAALMYELEEMRGETQ